MSTEAERLAELVTDLGHRLSDAFGDVISPEARRHLRNAQREALTALFLVYEEQMGRRTRRAAGEGEGDEDESAEGWPRDMEEAVRGVRPPARTKPKSRPTRVRKIKLD